MSQELRSHEGWFVLHLFYGLDRMLWNELLDESEKEAAVGSFEEVLERFRQAENCQAHAYSVWGHKADLAVMLVDPDLHHLNEFENHLLAALPSGVLTPIYSFTSMSEVSEYLSSGKDYDKHLREKEGLSPDSSEYQEKMESFKARMKAYTDERLYPQLPKHRVMSFYPMNKRREPEQNWYSLDFDRRKELMGGHMVTGRKYAGKVKQLVTGSVGLDEWEWGVTLFADDPVYFKQIVYEMRYDEVSAVYAEFGDFITCLEMKVPDLFKHLRVMAASQSAPAATSA
ncbi:MAG TPA: hydrogen peroxide-dependent heme synthase [Acidobacteriota bacterium]|nr:hydrogen peroxide-dependent heme synthase [Acidobacteriota bacterium]